MTDDARKSTAEAARAAIWSLVNTEQPPVIDPAACGDWAGHVTAILAAPDLAGRKQVYAALTAKDAGLIRLMASDSPDGWHVYTLADAYAPRPPVQYIVAGLFPLPSLSIVYAPPGCFKTLFLADMAAAVAAGRPWLPPLPGKNDNAQRATMQAPALWCDFDNGPRTMHERIEAVARARELPPDAPLYYVSMPSPWLDAGDYIAVAAVGELIRRYGAKVVMIDNLRDVSGKVDENSAEMGNVMSNFRRLAEETGAAVILVHHQRKQNSTAGRAGDSLRGHSSIEAAIDLALLLEREEYADSIKVKATKVRGPDVLPFGAVFTFEWKTGTRDLQTAMFYGLDAEDLASNAAIRRAILEEAATPHNKTELVAAVKEILAGVGVNRIRMQIDRLAAEGTLTMTLGAHGAQVYGLPKEKDRLEVELV